MAKCDQCQRTDVQTEHVADPWTREMVGEVEMMDLCDPCYLDRCLSV